MTGIPQRKVVINQKGGVGKTAIAAGIAEAMAEDGMRVLLVDYDPQGHLTDQLGIEQLPPGTDSLVLHMCGEGKGSSGTWSPRSRSSASRSACTFCLPAPMASSWMRRSPLRG